MREIKFRIWAMMDDELCKWSTGAKEDFNECDLNLGFGKFTFYIHRLVDDCISGEHEQYTTSEEADIVRLDEYTGLKDNNGVEIYEQDKCRYKNGYEYSIANIVMSDGAFHLVTDRGRHLLLSYKNDIEIIHNNIPKLNVQKKGSTNE